MMILFGGWMGAAALLGAVLTFFYYRHVAYRELGGITGDTAGYFLTLCEGVMVALWQSVDGLECERWNFILEVSDRAK